jgi:DNA repair exonuclease SbcCD nuclease subunit
MRLAHLADLHFSEEHYEECEASIETVIAEHGREPFDLIAIAGDTWDGPTQNSARARFADFLDLIRRLADCAPVAMVAGTPSHDTEGSLEVFETLASKQGITILRPGKTYFLVTKPSATYEGNFIREEGNFNPTCAKAILFGVREPTKAWLLANGGATGKDETDAAIRQHLSALFLGLGGIRREHPDLPCVLLYHGAVAGASTPVGYSIEPGTGIAATRDDLEAVGADYCALGHIHLPQQIKGLPAYYAGKIYTGDWNEQGYVPGCNIVEIDYDGFIPAAIVDRLYFPHPERVKIAQKGENYSSFESVKERAGGRLVWEEWTGTREWAEGFDPEARLAGLIVCAGALEGSRVTLNILPSETVRAGEIAEKKTLREKVQVWSENSSTTIAESILAKADELEREIGTLQQLSGQPRRFRNIFTLIRGSKGFWKRQRKDEVFVDWNERGPGVIAYVGPNGNGKTTSFDFSKPWPVPVSRPPKTLKAHFRLRDSRIENVYLEEISGVYYRSLINVNAATASGSAEYFLYRGPTAVGPWEPVSAEAASGRLDPYCAAVEDLFGPLAIYLRTAYAMQKPTKDLPDIGEATQGEKKELMSALSGKDYAEYKAEAKIRGDTLDSDLVRLEATIAAAADVDDTIARCESDIALQLEAEKTARGDEERTIEKGKRLKAERDLLAERVAELDRKAARKAQIEKELAQLLGEVAKAEKEIADFQDAAGRKGKAEEELARIAEFEREAAALREEKARIDGDFRKALVEFQEEGEGLRLHSETLRHDLETARKAHAQVEQDLAVASAKLSAPIIDTCPTCGQTLPADRLEALHHAHEDAEARICDLEAHSARTSEALEAARKAYEDNAAEFSKRVRPEPAPFPGAVRLADLESDLASDGESALREVIRKADEATVRIEAAERRRGEHLLKGAELKEEHDKIALDFAAGADGVREEFAAKERELEAERDHLTAARSAIAAAKAFRESAARNLEDARKRAAARDEAAVQRDESARERDDWRLLERALDGVRDLELDALAPSISDIATRLLAASGDSGHIEIRTTRDGGKGAKRHQIEDFLIYYVDQSGDEQDLATCSGGEMVWQRQALYNAFSVIRLRNASIQFVTGFLDETDGALDPTARMNYFRMLEAAHAQSGRYQTILITQSKDLAAMASQVIDVTALGVAPVKTEDVAA